MLGTNVYNFEFIKAFSVERSKSYVSKFIRLKWYSEHWNLLFVVIIALTSRSRTAVGHGTELKYCLS